MPLLSPGQSLRRGLRAAARQWAPSLLRVPKKQTWRTRLLLRRLEWTSGVRTAEVRQIHRTRLEHLRPVTQPLVLISQVQRSGGTLLSQLFDGHPECHAHPAELEIGYPRKPDWPDLDVAGTPDRWFRTLFEPHTARDLRRGYAKPRRLDEGEYRRYPFVFLPSLQRAVFLHCLERRPARSPRDILDAYMTSYFHAWLDNHNLYGGEKRYVTAFVPGMSSKPENLARFFSIYPDGRLISIVRDPKSWYVSDRAGRKRARPAPAGVARWLASTRAALEARRTYGPRVRLLSFEALVGDTGLTMRALADWLGIAYGPSLACPTFNGFPIAANSSFAIGGAGIVREPLERRAQLSEAEARAIDDETADVLRAASAVMD